LKENQSLTSIILTWANTMFMGHIRH